MNLQYLYHYTSIESLALILSTKTIRFNSLSQVDDLIEGKSKDFKQIGNYFFISSWTDIEEESLPFWNMYTPQMRGVRIKMPTDLFHSYQIRTSKKYGLKPAIVESIVPQEETYSNTYFIIPTHTNYLSKVIYTDDEDKLFPTLAKIQGNNYKVEFNRVGVHKSTHWEFQSEWRFILKIFPITSKAPIQDKSSISNIISDALFSLSEGDKIPFSDYFVKIKEEKLKEMEILLGPKHSDANKVIVNSLINNYNPNAKLKISTFHKKIK